MKNESMLSVAEVFEMEPGTEQDPNWVNPGVVGYVEKIVRTKVKRTGAPMNICTLRDLNGSVTISMSVFGAIKFNEGDTIEARDGGIRRTEYNQLAQISLGKGTTIHVVTQGRSAATPPPERKAPPTDLKTGRAVQPPPAGGPRINGQTVGMAMKEGIALVCRAHEAAKVAYDITKPDFWADVHTCASDLIRVSAMLESGRLAPSPKNRLNPPPPEKPPAEQGRADPPKTSQMPLPGKDGAVALPEGDEDVPF